jgi:hypothetical protein
MIFADLKYSGCYEGVHDELFSFLQRRFDHVEGGLQGDSWIFVRLNGEEVQIDTFLSMTHQIKSPRPGEHVQSVIAALRARYEVLVYAEPEPEPHEGS